LKGKVDTGAASCIEASRVTCEHLMGSEHCAKNMHGQKSKRSEQITLKWLQSSSLRGRSLTYLVRPELSFLVQNFGIGKNEQIKGKRKTNISQPKSFIIRIGGTKERTGDPKKCSGHLANIIVTLIVVQW
jgi:hypothetical protein